MRLKLERCWADNEVRATVMTGQHIGCREFFTIDLDSVSRREAVGIIRDRFVNLYGANRNSIKSEWWN